VLSVRKVVAPVNPARFDQTVGLLSLTIFCVCAIDGDGGHFRFLLLLFFFFSGISPFSPPLPVRYVAGASLVAAKLRYLPIFFRSLAD